MYRDYDQAMNYVPFTNRLSGDTEFAELKEGVPPHLVQPLWKWVRPFFNGAYARGRYQPSEAKLLELQNRLQLYPPFDWRTGPYSAESSFEQRFGSDQDFALNATDYALHHHAHERDADSLRELLVSGGSAWGVDVSTTGRFQLVPRQAGPIRDVIESARVGAAVAHDHLNDAWLQANAHNPNPSAAYSDAVKAIEAAAIPIVSPDNQLATLGTIIADLKAKPEKWTVSIDGFEVADLTRMCEIVWKGQTDRHAPARREVEAKDARAAVFLAVSLVGLFSERLARQS